MNSNALIQHSYQHPSSFPLPLPFPFNRCVTTVHRLLELFRVAVHDALACGAMGKDVDGVSAVAARVATEGRWRRSDGGVGEIYRHRSC